MFVLCLPSYFIWLINGISESSELNFSWDQLISLIFLCIQRIKKRDQHYNLYNFPSAYNFQKYRLAEFQENIFLYNWKTLRTKFNQIESHLNSRELLEFLEYFDSLSKYT